MTDRLNEFTFYTFELLNPLKGSKGGALALAATNALVAGYFISNGDTLRSNAPFLLYTAGFLLRRVAYNAYDWAREYRRNYLIKGWERLDRQICVASNALVASGSAILAYKLGIGIYENYSTAPSPFAATFVATIDLLFANNAVLQTRRSLKIMRGEMGGFKNFLAYRSQYSIDNIPH
jgi:hypothetical protein